jgi:AraC family transcriptional regulator
LHPGGVDGEIAEVLAALEGRQSAPRTPGVTSAIAALAPRPDAPALRVDIAAAGLLLAIAEAVRPRAARVPTPLRAQVLVARDYLDEHFAEDVDLATLARVASVSPFHLARAFRAEVGIPPHAYLVERRLDRAAALLGSGDGTVTQVAMAVGFRSPAHFAKRFRRRFGTSPSAFRAD